MVQISVIKNGLKTKRTGLKAKGRGESEFNELKDENSKVIDHLEDQLAQSENVNANIVSEKNEVISEHNKTGAKIQGMLSNFGITLLRQ